MILSRHLNEQIFRFKCVHFFRMVLIQKKGNDVFLRKANCFFSEFDPVKKKCKTKRNEKGEKKSISCPFASKEYPFTLFCPKVSPFSFYDKNKTFKLPLPPTHLVVLVSLAHGNSYLFR